MVDARSDHPVVKDLHNDWHKLLAIIMHKYDLKNVEITLSDILSLGQDMIVLADARNNKLVIRLLTQDELQQLK